MKKNHRINSNKTAAVSLHYEFLPMETCPIGVKVLLLGGVATIGQWNGKEKFWRGWYPLPMAPKSTPRLEVA